MGKEKLNFLISNPVRTEFVSTYCFVCALFGVVSNVCEVVDELIIIEK
jgi:hypothetical protein